MKYACVILFMMYIAACTGMDHLSYTTSHGPKTPHQRTGSYHMTTPSDVPLPRSQSFCLFHHSCTKQEAECAVKKAIVDVAKLSEYVQKLHDKQTERIRRLRLSSGGHDADGVPPRVVKRKSSRTLNTSAIRQSLSRGNSGQLPVLATQEEDT